MGTNDFGLDGNKKTYRVWKKVVMWVCESFEADSDEEAIQLAKNGDYWTEEFEYGDDYHELQPDENGIVRIESNYPVTEELYDEEGELLWDNKPVKIKRDEKIDKILE